MNQQSDLSDPQSNPEPADPATDTPAAAQTPPVDADLEGAPVEIEEAGTVIVEEGEVGSSGLADILAIDDLREQGLGIWGWVQANILTVNSLIQLCLLLAAIVPALYFGPKLRRVIERRVRPRAPAGILRRLVDGFATVMTLIALWVVLAIFIPLVGPIERLVDLISGFGRDGAELAVDPASVALLSAARSLLLAAIFIRLVTLVIRSPFWSKVAFYVAWPIAALDAFGILGNVVDRLENAAIPLTQGESLSMLDVVRGIIYFALVFWLISVAASLLNRRLQNVDELNPSFKALLNKIISFVAPILALVVALPLIGVNLASLAVFSGAVGLGIGLGLQKIIGNFLAGFTLLADKSIKPGDTVEVEGIFGWITEMKSRYVAIRTRDGHAHLVPNAKFIDEGVVNWSHDDRAVRIHAPFGVTYEQRDLRLVQRLAVESAQGVDRVLKQPGPVCNLVGFGDSSVDFDLRFWINDPPNGIANVRSEVMLRIWEALHEHDIEIPFPQRDLHIRSSALSPAQMAAVGVDAGVTASPESA